MKICTIIVSYNFEKCIDKCLDSLIKSSLPTTVIVIDNASKDNTCAIISERYPSVVLVENKDNLGFGKANNIGFKYAIEKGYDYVFLLNQDAWIEAQTLQRLVDASLRNPDYGIISPIHLNGAGANLDFGFATYSSLNSIKQAEAVDQDITECKFINAALWLIPISVLKEVGGFAPIFPHYGEDMDYVHRTKFSHYKIGFVKGAYGYHDREHREVSREKYFYTEYIYFLSEATNITYSSIKSFGYSYLASIKKSLLSLVSGKVSDSYKYLKISFQLLGKYAESMNTRKISSSSPTPFL